MSKSKMKWYDWLAYSLVTIGAVNWSLIGIANFNLVNWILNTMPMLEKITYIIVGLAGLYSIYTAIKISK